MGLVVALTLLELYQNSVSNVKSATVWISSFDYIHGVILYNLNIYLDEYLVVF